MTDNTPSDSSNAGSANSESATVKSDGCSDSAAPPNETKPKTTVEMVDKTTEPGTNSDNSVKPEKNGSVSKSTVEKNSNADAAKSKSEPKLAPKNTAANTVAEGKQPKRSNKIAWLACLLAILALLAVGYLAWQLLQQRDTDRSAQLIVDEHYQLLQSLQTTLASNQKNLASQVAKRDLQMAKLRESLVEAELSIDAHSRRMLSLTATTTDDWRLAEVEYLLRLANQRILTSKDGKTALNLLQAADKIVLELANPQLFSVRKAIANDTVAIAAVGEYDIEGIFLELSALSLQVNKLQSLLLPSFQAQQTENESEPAEPETLPSWFQPIAEIGRSTWREIRALVVIQNIDQPIKPLLPPEQQFYLKSNLRLLISQAQLSLLDGRQATYQSSLQSAASWVQEFFPQEYASNEAMFSALQRLSSNKVSSEYPDVSGSLLAIKAFIAAQHKLAAGHTDDEGKPSP